MSHFIHQHRFPVLLFAIVVVVLAMTYIEPSGKAEAFHTKDELDYFALRSSMDLPGGGNILFKASGECAGCHGFDEAGFASVDANGNDVNVVDDWRATMMANSARDPFWRAKVSHEVMVNPTHKAAIEDKCTSCHAPQGHYASKFMGETHYSISDMLLDPVALDGVGCASCHQQSQDSIGLLFSGKLKYTTDVLYGPYDAPPPIFGSPMMAWIGFDAQYGPHVETGEFCAGCHTLITETIDLNGVLTNNHFVEQATYHEWVNSVYVDTESCQSCHLPRIEDDVVLSTGYSFLEGRSPYGLHYMVGGNTFMLKLLKENINELMLTANETHFDTVIARTKDLLQNHTLDIELTAQGIEEDTARYQVRLFNKAGHKFPSGYPARLAFIEFVVTDAVGDTLFASGLLDEDYNIIDRDEDYEPHYDVINHPSQVQIYEMVMGDVNGDPTTVLLRAAYPIKDNRLTPVGFSTSHFAYDTTLIAGLALLDENFNHIDGVEGSGTDDVHYHIPLNGYDGPLNVSAKVYYQAVPRKWLDEMFDFESDEIDLFRDMFEGADHTPELINEASIVDFVTSTRQPRPTERLKAFPSPTSDGFITIEVPESDRMQVTMFDMSGRMLFNESMIVNRRFPFVVPDKAGVYLIRIESQRAVYTTRVVRQ